MKVSTLILFLCGCGFGLAVVTLTIAVTPPRPERSVRSVETPLPVSWWQRLQVSRVRRSVPTAVVAGGLLWWVTGWPVAGLSGVAAVVGLPPVLAPARPRRALALAEALAPWCRRVADLLAAGSGGLDHALTRSAAITPEPLAEPVQRMATRLHHHGAEPALRQFAAELADPAVDEIVLALLLRLQHGGRGLAATLTAHAEALAAEASSRRDIEADRATTRTTVRCLIGITLVLFAGLLAFARDYLAPLGSPLGQGVLAAAALLAAGALWWLHHLTTRTPTARYLTEHSTQDSLGGGS